MRPHNLVFSLLLTLLSITTVQAATVYAVVGADTSSVFSTNGTHLSTNYANQIDMGEMSTEGVYPTIMTEQWRMAHLDSHGNPMVFTWWMLTGGWHQQATNVDSIAATRVYQDHWQAESDRWGDEIALHFHHFAWINNAWKMAPTFAEKLWDFEWSISQMVLDCDVFPVGFRSGWNYMDNIYQRELERWIPFRMEAGSWLSQDVPYHPSPTNYRAAGSMRGWEARHRYIGVSSIPQSTIDQIFTWADAGQDQVTAFWSHQYENDYVDGQVQNLHDRLTDADARFPNVDFRYVTSRDAMRLFQGSDDLTPPTITLTIEEEGFFITTDGPIYQEQPWVAARLVSDEHVRLDSLTISNTQWQVLSIPPSIDEIAVAVSDMMGNVTIERLDRGERRWSTQTEMHRASPEGIEALSAPGIATLGTGVGVPLIDQPVGDSETDPLLQSYWIGQTFVPTQPGLTAVDIGLSVSEAPATVRVELREVDANGFPDLSADALIATGVASAETSGLVRVPMTFDGFTLDGRQYGLVFLRVDGAFEIQLHRTGTMDTGNLTRAYSLDWIHIPLFDCHFATIDQSGQPDQAQTTFEADAYIHSTGHFLAQTFTADVETIGAVEILVSSVTAPDDLALQLRRTDVNGHPDLSSEALIDSITTTALGTGTLRFETDWQIAPADQGSTLALLFVSPQTGNSTAQLMMDPSITIPGGALFQFNDTEMVALPGSLALRIETQGHVDSGTLTFEHTLDQPAWWSGVTLDGDFPADTSLATRIALDQGPWTNWVGGTQIDMLHAAAQAVRLQVKLMSLDNAETPTLDGVTIGWKETPPHRSEQGLVIH